MQITIQHQILLIFEDVDQSFVIVIRVQSACNCQIKVPERFQEQHNPQREMFRIALQLYKEQLVIFFIPGSPC